MFRRELLIMFVILLANGCNGKAQVKQEDKIMDDKAEIYLAGGCFWGMEHFCKQINGVTDTQVGFANGHTARPSYQQVCNDNTGHAETVRVVYNPHILPLRLLIALYFKAIDPTSINKQGGDIGTQYRTGIFYTDKADLSIIQDEVKELAMHYNKPIAVEVMKLRNFYPAEDYHQDYLDKNINGYCHISYDLFEMARQANAVQRHYSKPDDKLLKDKLTELQYDVTQRSATEAPFHNDYVDEFREGIYVDVTTGEPLFLSTDKFESGCGWPAFSKPIDNTFIIEKKDSSHDMMRTEVRSTIGNAHLGHVFNDGPKDSGGLRYCINSAALRFVPKDKMKAEGYGNYLLLLNNDK